MEQQRSSPDEQEPACVLLDTPFLEPLGGGVQHYCQHS
jgi:hypothetical protein